MKFRFIGEYTNGHTSINSSGVTFVGREPSEVTDPEAIRRLTGNIEFEEVGEVLVSTDEPAPKRRGRPRKVD